MKRGEKPILKGLLGIICLLLIVNTVSFVQAETTILDASEARLALTITSDVTLTPTQNGAYVTEAEAQLNWYPRTTYNQRLEQESKNEKTFALIPRIGTQTIAYEATVVTNNEVSPVTRKIPFPVTVPQEQQRYLEPTNLIDVNEDIRATAAKIALGQNEQYRVVFGLADWVTTNIIYNLSTITSEAVQPSSWVLEERYGVCDEMTNLFISMNRALGIPARFVSGVAYTTINGKETWEAHGWAEVWFQDIGWVPFDVTYGEYGFLDAGHIKLTDGVDSDEASIEVDAKGIDFTVSATQLTFSVDVLEKKEHEQAPLTMSLTPTAETIGFDSYNELALRVENKRDYYLSTRIELGETKDMQHITEDEYNVILGPYEQKEFPILVKIDELREGYSYVFPVTAYGKLSSPITATFRAEKNGPLYDENMILQEQAAAAFMVQDIVLPKTITYDEEKTLSFTVIKEGVGNPTSMTVRVEHEFFEHEWKQEPKSAQKYELSFYGNRLKTDNNTITIRVTYIDDEDQMQETTETVSIALANLTFEQKMMLWLDSLDRWLENLFQ